MRLRLDNDTRAFTELIPNHLQSLIKNVSFRSSLGSRSPSLSVRCARRVASRLPVVSLRSL